MLNSLCYIRLFSAPQQQANGIQTNDTKNRANLNKSHKKFTYILHNISMRVKAINLDFSEICKMHISFKNYACEIK